MFDPIAYFTSRGLPDDLWFPVGRPHTVSECDAAVIHSSERLILLGFVECRTEEFSASDFIVKLVCGSEGYGGGAELLLSRDNDFMHFAARPRSISRILKSLPIGILSPYDTIVIVPRRALDFEPLSLDPWGWKAILESCEEFWLLGRFDDLFETLHFRFDAEE